MGGLYLNLNIKDQNQKLHIFSARLNSLRDQPQLQKWFDTIQQLKDHLKQQKNLNINLPNKKLTILISATKNTVRHVPIGELSLTETNVSENQILKEIIFQCKKDIQISGSQLKRMILSLSQILVPIVEKRRGDVGDGGVEILSVGQNQNWQRQNQEESSINKNDEIRWQYDRRITSLQNKIQTINEQLQQLTQKLKQQRDGTNLQRRMSSKQKISKSLIDLVDPICKDFDFLKISNSLITVQQGIWGAYIFGKKKIKSKNSFSIKIVKAQKFIAVGIASQELRTQQIKGSDNHILYDNCKKIHGPGLVLFDQGKGFKSGQTVTVIIHQNSCDIVWKVNHEVRLTYKNHLLGDFSIQWVPLIQLPNVGDCIQWID